MIIPLKFLIVATFSTCVEACTSIIFGPGATEDGYPLTSHSNDCDTCDNRMAFVPAKNTQPSKRAVFNGKKAMYPRIVTSGRAEIYEPTDYNAAKIPIGSELIEIVQSLGLKF
jgi:hypothetical protein